MKMISDMKISDSIVYVGANDKTIELFESQYPVPNGVSYNSYVILDEKVAVMDTVDPRATEEWFANLERVLAGRRVDYLVVSHMEPDHAGNVQKFAEKYPEAKIVGNAKTFGMMAQFFDFDVTDRKVEVKEGGTLELGSHTLQFFMAPMVHWPEVMVAYEQSEKILFSADGFGKFGATDVNEEWDDEAGRYFLNIVGKYGVQVQALLKKASGLDIRMICPLHGPILKENLGHYLGLYQTWSSYEPEKKGVLVAFASIHGNTAKASQLMAEYLRENGEADVTVMDLSRTDVSYAVRKAFYYDRIVLAGATYDGGVFPCMEEFLLHLKSKNYQKRTVGIIENGTWAPLAGKVMKGILETMKNITIAEPMVTIRSTVKEDTKEQMKELAKVLTA